MFRIVSMERRCSGTSRGATHAEYSRARSTRSPIVGALVALLLAMPAHAQLPLPADSAPRGLIFLGSPADDRARVAELLGARPRGTSLLRSASSDRGASSRTHPALQLIGPDAVVVYNSALAVPMNESALWAGRGTSALVRVGVEFQTGRLRIVLAPEVTASQNRQFEIRPDSQPGRSAFAWPWSTGRSNIDLPSRFGDRAWRLLSPGQSSLSIDAGALTVGAATENEWWGPGLRNALLLSNAAEGFPHAFARTRHPLHTRAGDIEARLLSGALLPSVFADSSVVTRWRSFSGFAAVLRPALVPSLSLGVARAVIAPVGSSGGALSHAADALTLWQAPPADSAHAPRADQYTSLFARWIIPQAHAELYGELAKELTPRSVREALLFPDDARGVTLGVQAVRPFAGAGPRARALRTQLEYTSVEQSITFRDRPVPPPFYTGLANPDGYTYRGRPLGAAIGPGGSSQWVAVDLLTPRYTTGLAFGRTRWNNDALYDQPNPTFLRHDVSLYVAARATVRAPRNDVAAELYWMRRDNYLFQNGYVNPGRIRTIDVPNVTLALHVTARRDR